MYQMIWAQTPCPDSILIRILDPCATYTLAVGTYSTDTASGHATWKRLGEAISYDNSIIYCCYYTAVGFGVYWLLFAPQMGPWYASSWYVALAFSSDRHTPHGMGVRRTSKQWNNRSNAVYSSSNTSRIISFSPDRHTIIVSSWSQCVRRQCRRKTSKLRGGPVLASCVPCEVMTLAEGGCRPDHQEGVICSNGLGVG